MKTTICVKGVGSSGKSETIKLLYNLIKQNHQYTETSYILGADIKTILTIGRYKIGIESQGDPGNRLKISLDDFIAAGCDIIICACRTSGMTVNWVNNTYTHGYRILIAPNYNSRHVSSSAINQLSAKHLLELFGEVLNGRI